MKVRSSLQKVDSLADLSLTMQPAAVHFRIDPDKESIQDLIRAVRAAGSQYDARLMLQSDANDDKLSEALRAVKGVRSAGMQDSKGIRLVTFFLDQRTLYSDLDGAALSIGAKLSSPVLTKQ